VHRLTILLLAALLPIVGCGAEEPTDGTETRSSPVSPETPLQTIGDIERLDPAIDSLVPSDAVIEVLAEGFEWSEGPVWISDGEYLLFSDVPQNKIFQWKEGEGHRLWLEPSGYTGEIPRGGEPGSNGLLLDAQNRLILCQHGDRRVARLDVPLTAPEPVFITLADRYDGKRFNSPNDAVFDSSGALYFTDPPYGLPEGPSDPTKEISFNGVYRLAIDGRVTLLTDELSRPNGIALSPDEKTLYVANSDPARAIWMAYDLLPDGAIGNGRLFFDAAAWVPERAGLPDGLKVDDAGNLFATGPGGVLVFSPDGRHLGTLRTTQATANCAFGENESSLYMTADNYLLRVRLKDRTEDSTE
jgi:gluconolactonase